MNVSLTKQLEAFVKKKVKSGRYHTASEVVREGLRLLEERDTLRQAALTEVREKVRVGLDQADRGLVIDGERALAELIERYNEPPRERQDRGSIRSHARRKGRSARDR